MTPMSTTIRRSLTLAAALAVAAVALGGCTQSPTRTRYLDHLSASVDAGPAKDDRLAIAFGLDGHDDFDTAVVRAENGTRD